MSSGRKSWVAATLLVAMLLLGLTFIPGAQATTGKWRNINPTEYTSIPDARLNSIYVLNGGTGGIGSGNAWAVGNNGTLFHWDGFSWTNQSIGTPCTLNSVNFGSPLSVPSNEISSSAGWIVGGNNSATVCSGPRAFFWNGNSWFNASQGLISGGMNVGNLSSVFLYQVSGSSVSAFAVGANATAGTAYQFNGVPGGGAGWVQTPVQGSSSCSLTSVYMVSTTEGWAVGHCGKIYHWQGGGWTLANSPGFAGVNFYSIFMVSSTEGWAVGSEGKISQFTGGTWQSPVTPSTTTNTLRSLMFVSSNEGWAVGDGATIVRYQSGVWTALNAIQVPTLRGIRGVHATGSSNVWAVGETGSTLLWDGSVWGSITAPLQTNYNAVWMTGSSDGAAVGNVTSGAPTIVRWDGVKWVRPQGAAAITDLWSVWEVNSGEWWVVGGGPGFYPYILHMTSVTSTSFTGVSLPVPCANALANCVLRDVYGTGSNNVWAVGDGGLFAQWTGGPGWGSVGVIGFTDANTYLRSITFVGGDQNNGWAVGYQGPAVGPVIYQRTSTTNFGIFCTGCGLPANVRLNAVQFYDSTHGWIAADNGWILFYDGTNWNPVFTVGSYNLTAIHVTSTTDGWAVGQDTATGKPVFVHWDGTAWSTVGTIPPFDKNDGRLLSMFLLSSTDGFAVGTTAGAGGIASLGMMFHLDPPGGVFATTSISSTPTTTTSAASTISSTLSSSSISSSTSTSSTEVTTSSSLTSTVVSTSVVTSTVISTPTTMSTSSSLSTVSTPMTLPPVPGFPWESIIAGIILGLTVLAIARRRRK